MQCKLQLNRLYALCFNMRKLSEEQTFLVRAELKWIGHIYAYIYTPTHTHTHTHIYTYMLRLLGSAFWIPPFFFPLKIKYCFKIFGLWLFDYLIKRKIIIKSVVLKKWCQMFCLKGIIKNIQGLLVRNFIKQKKYETKILWPFYFP